MKNKYFIGALIGIGVFLAVKYVVVGLLAWNSALHPKRTEDANSPFLYPFLGIGKTA